MIPVRLYFLLACLLACPAQATEPVLACSEMQVFVREGCPHCDDAKRFLEGLQQRQPQLEIRLRDVGESPEARKELQRLSAQRRIRQPGVPTFHFCDQLLVGFDSALTSGASIERVLSGQQQSLQQGLVVSLPLFGDLYPAVVGLPAFTIAVGLVDGFNPCAMWVLLFLLSLLVHVPSRARILLVAGTFVLVSGIVYFAFMAAWLNIFLLVGYSRGLQLVLGALALLVGVVHIKDFFALRRGISLSIPAGVKPGLYQRIRRVVRAENLFAALAGVTLMAVLVNFVELLCTAGLPALYTQVLSYYSLDTAGYYGYLLLYNIAYILDDGIMVAIAVVTLGQYKLQERGGRWLKLLSGALIFMLGMLLVFSPQWLIF